METFQLTLFNLRINLCINALRDKKTKMLSLQPKKWHQRSNLWWHYIKNLMSRGVIFM